MAYRFVRLGMTPDHSGPNDNTQGQVFNATAPIPSGLDDPSDYSNLDVAAQSDPVYVGDCDAASIFFYSDATSTSSMRAYVGPTPTGPWVAIGLGAVSNAALATPTLVDVFGSGHADYVQVTTASWSAGNPRALLVGGDY